MVWNRLSHAHTLTIATARSYQKACEFLAALHLDAPMILMDGSMVVTPKQEIIDLKLIDQALADAVIAQSARFGISPFIIGLEDEGPQESFLAPRHVNLYQHRVLQNYQNDPRLRRVDRMRAKRRNLKIVYFGTHADLHPLAERLKSQFGERLEYKLAPEKYTNGWFLTLLHPKGDKAHALQKVSDYLGCGVSEMTVFGDSLNDLGMFASAGRAVAVANALREVKEAADLVLPHTNDEDAVARFLAKIT
jgi:5-amino-6-(5-phospho-D-ribitylamino)uracil phosphatase